MRMAGSDPVFDGKSELCTAAAASTGSSVEQRAQAACTAMDC